MPHHDRSAGRDWLSVSVRSSENMIREAGSENVDVIFIDHLVDIGVDALNPVQVTARDMEPARLKAAFGDRMAFWGGINTQDVLPHQSADAVTVETERCIDVFGKHGGYVLNAVHNIQFEVPPENIVAMYDAGLRHRYH